MAWGRGSGTGSRDGSWVILGTVALVASVGFVGYAAYTNITQHGVDTYVSAPVAAVSSPPPAPVVTAPPSTDPVVYFVGDSFSVGTSESTFPELISASKGWSPQCICEPAAGYVADTDTPSKMAFAEGIVASGLSKASRIVVSGGADDQTQDAQAFDESVKATVDALAAAAPGVPVTFLSTFYSNTQDDVPDAILTMNATIEKYAAESGAQYIDVSQLFYGRDDAVGPDGLTPNDVGQQLIADTVGPQISI